MVSARVKHYAQREHLIPGRIRITDAKTCLGSCGYRGTLNFCWRLVLAPLWVVDYVVAHELAHLVERNHSRKFWQKVETIFPDYKKAHEWLKTNNLIFL